MARDQLIALVALVGQAGSLRPIVNRPFLGPKSLPSGSAPVDNARSKYGIGLDRLN